jgi:hypothetical protein
VPAAVAVAHHRSCFWHACAVTSSRCNHVELPCRNAKQTHLQDEPLDAAGTRAAFEALTAEVNASEAAAGKPPKSVDEVAMGFVRVANEAMCRPIRCACWARIGEMGCTAMAENLVPLPTALRERVQHHTPLCAVFMQGADANEGL